MKSIKLNIKDTEAAVLEFQYWPELNVVALQATEGNVTSKLLQFKDGILTIFDHELTKVIQLSDGTNLRD